MNSAEILIEFATYLNVKPWIDDIFFSYEDGNLFASSCDGQWDDAAYFYANVTGDDSNLATFACIGELECEIELVENIFGMNRLDVAVGFSKIFSSIVPNIELNEDYGGATKQIAFKEEDGDEAFYMLTSKGLAAESTHPKQFKLTPTLIEITPSKVELANLRALAVEAEHRGSNHFFPLLNSRGDFYVFYDLKLPSSASPRSTFKNARINESISKRTYPIDTLLKVLLMIRNAQQITMRIVEGSFFIIEARSKSGALFSYILCPNSNMQEIYPQEDSEEVHRIRYYEDFVMSSDWLPEE